MAEEEEVITDFPDFEDVESGIEEEDVVVETSTDDSAETEAPIYYSFKEYFKENPDETYQKTLNEYNKYNTPQQIDKDAINSFNGQIKAEAQVDEQNKMESNDPDGVWNTVVDTMKHAGFGLAKMPEEVGQALGILDDDAWNIPKPENTRQALAQGFSQALSFFIPATWALKGPVAAIKVGSALTTIFNTSKKLKRAQQFLTSVIAGAGTDSLAFDYRDPNAANMLLLIDGIANNPTAASILYDYLAIKPEGYRDPETGELDPDTEFEARVKKNIPVGGATGVVAAAVIRSILKSMGWTYSKISTTAPSKMTDVEITKSLNDELNHLGRVFEEETGVSLKTFEQATTDYVEEALPILKETFDGSTKAEQQAILDGLPKNIDAAIINDIERALTDPVAKLSKAHKDPNPELVNFLTKIANNEKLDYPDYYYTVKKGKHKGKKRPIIESFNLLKATTTPEIKGQIQALSRIIKTKDLKDQDYLSKVQDVADMLGRPRDEVMEMLSHNVGNLEKSVGYVDAYKVLVLTSLEETHRAFRKFKSAKVGTEQYDQSLKERNAAAAHLERVTRLASKESSLAGQLLEAHRARVDLDNYTLIQQKVVSELIDAGPEAELKFAASVDNLINISKKRTENFASSVDIKVKIPGAAPRIVKVDPTKSRKAKRFRAKQDATTARIKRLEKRLKDLRAGKLPKKAVPRLKTAKELELEDLIEIELEKLTIPKEQKALQLKHAKLIKKIKELEKGKVTSTGFKELKTTEISQLKLKLKQVQKRLKKPKTDPEKAETNIKKLRAELDKLLLTKKGTQKPVKSKREITALEKELVDEIGNQKKRLGWLKSKSGLTVEDLRELALQTATKEEARIIDKSTFRQIRMRLLASKMTLWDKYRGINQEIYINGLLSSFKTPIVNGIGNNYALGMTPIDKFMAAYKGGGPVTYKEGVIFAYNSMKHIPTALKMFTRAMRYGVDDFQIKTDIQKPHERMISKELLQVSGWKGQAFDWIGTGINLPAKLVLSMDVAYKGLTEAGEVPALAYRKAVSEFMEKNNGLKPNSVKELAEVELRSKDILDDIDKYPDIKEGAKKLSEINTYTNPLTEVPEEYLTAEGFKTRMVPGFNKRVQQTIESDPTGIVRTYLPFYQTPVNLIKYSWERTPLLNKFHSELKRELNPDISPPDIVQMAKGRVAAGQMMLWGSFGLAMAGNITNGPPSDPRLRKRAEAAMGGPHWWTFNIGTGPIPYSRWDPIGIIFAQASILAKFAKTLTHLNQQASFDEEGNSLADERKLVNKYNELWSMGVSNLQSLLKDRHYLQGITDVLGIFDEDMHEKMNWLKRLRSGYDPRISIFSSLRRNIVKGIEAEVPMKAQPPRPEIKEGESPFEISVKARHAEIMTYFDEQLKTVTGHGDIEGVQNLMGETVFYPGTHWEYENHHKPFEYVHNMVNSVFNIAATGIGTSESQSAVIRKLAELESTIEAPSQIYSFSVGVNRTTGKSMGTVMLTTEEKSFFMKKWIEYNTENNYLEKRVRSSEFNKMPPTEQLLELEKELSEGKYGAMKDTKDKFKDLRERMESLKDQSFEGISKPVLPTLGTMKPFEKMMSPLQPLEQGQ